MPITHRQFGDADELRSAETQDLAFGKDSSRRRFADPSSGGRPILRRGRSWPRLAFETALIIHREHRQHANYSLVGRRGNG